MSRKGLVFLKLSVHIAFGGLFYFYKFLITRQVSFPIVLAVRVTGGRISVVPIVVGWERPRVVATKVTPISIIVEVVSRDKINIYLLPKNLKEHLEDQ